MFGRGEVLLQLHLDESMKDSYPDLHKIKKSSDYTLKDMRGSGICRQG
jgi:hypothetical protein